MTEYLALGTSIGLPVLLGLLYRVSSPHIFFSVMAGELLARYFGKPIETIATAIAPLKSLAAYAEPAVLIAPMVLTAIFLRNSLSKGKALLHILPLLITGIVLAAFALPILPPAVQSAVRSIKFGDILLNLNGLIIGLVVLAQLAALWLLHRKDEKKKSKSKKAE